MSLNLNLVFRLMLVALVSFLAAVVWVILDTRAAIRADLSATQARVSYQLERMHRLGSGAPSPVLSPQNATPNTLRLPLGFTDQWNWGFGLEFHASSRLDLRAGMEIRDSVIPDDQRQIMAPFGGANLWYGVSVG